MRTLNVGALVHQVEIQQLADGVDASGAPIQVPTTLLAGVDMARETERSGEKFMADQLSGAMVTIWHMRYHPLMDPTLVDVPKTRRLLYQTRIYDITSAETIDRKVGIMLYTLASSKVPS